jgi:flavodoxin
MKALIVYDSFFGNTEKIAGAIGNYLSTEGNVKVVKVTNVKPEHLKGIDILIVGSPTRGSKATMPIVKFLIKIPAKSLQGVKVAAFDTRINVSEVKSWALHAFAGLFGYASKPIAYRLKKRGGNLAVPPEGFFVKNSEVVLKDGELERAADWAKQILKGE